MTRVGRTMTIALAAALLLGAAVAAKGATVGISPGGAISATSNGNLTLSSSLGSMSCPVTLNGTLATAAEGTMTEAPEPATNPHGGTITSGTVGTCSTGTASLVIPAEQRPEIYAYEATGEVAGVYIEDVQILISAFSIARCTIRAGVNLAYDIETGSASIVGFDVLGTRALAGGICPEGPGLAGRYAISPVQAVYEERVAILTCREDVNRLPAFDFEIINPGGISTRRVTCTNDSPAPLTITVVAGSRIWGPFRAHFTLVSSPAVGERIRRGETTAITLRFTPRAEAPYDTWFVAAWMLETDWGMRFIRAVGKTERRR